VTNENNGSTQSDNERYFDDDRSKDPGRGQMALARALPLLIFTLCAVGIISIMAIRNYQRFSSSATMFDATAVVCSGLPAPSAAPFDSSGDTAIHPTVAFFIFNNGLIRADNSYIPESWQPQSIEEVSWVMCIEADRPAYRVLCDNEAIVNEYGRELVVTMRSAQTADVLAVDTITSEEIADTLCWDELPTVRPPDPATVERVPVARVEAWLESFSAGLGQ